MTKTKGREKPKGAVHIIWLLCIEELESLAELCVMEVLQVFSAGSFIFLIEHLCCSSILLLVSTFLACAVAALLIWRRREQSSRVRLPPGPRSLPIIGHLHLLGDLPHQSLFKLARIHGPLMQLKLGSTVAIVASSPEMAKEILQTHDQIFASRPGTAGAIHAGFDRTDIGFAPYGPYWKLMRQLCVTDLFSHKRMEAFRPIRVEEVGALLRSVLEDSADDQVRKSLILLRPKLLATTNNIISRMTLGKRLFELASSSQQREASHDMVAVVAEGLTLVGAFNIGDYIPLLAGLDLQGYVRRMKVYKRRVKALLQEMINARRDERRPDPCDLLDVLISTSSSGSVKLTTPLTDDNIKAVMMDMFVAGTESSGGTVEWALAELLANPMAMKKVQEELDSIVGQTQLVQETHIPHLPYLQAVVKETMRLHPIGPLLLPHESTQACQIAGYHIPAKTRAYVNVWAIGRDPSVWRNPLVFLPERFLESDVEMCGGKQFHLLPFGSGRRACPAWALGLLTVQFLLASLLQCFDWSLPTSHAHGSKVDMSEIFGLAVKMANPIRAMATPRLPTNMIMSIHVDAQPQEICLKTRHGRFITSSY